MRHRLAKIRERLAVILVADTVNQQTAASWCWPLRCRALSDAQKHTQPAVAAHHQTAHYPSADEAPSTCLSPPRLCAQRARKPA